MELQPLIEKLKKLPPRRQREVANFIAFLAGQGAEKASAPPKRKLSEEPFIGRWKNRPEMQDSSEWVRNLRRSEWKS